MIPIGVTCSYQERHGRFRLDAAYCAALEKAGGLPLIIPALRKERVKGYLSVFRGLLLSGGGDVDPLFFGEEPLPGCGGITPQRDEVELELLRQALEQDMPVLAVCRGMQVLNIACGGDIFQDLSMHKGTILQHWQKAPDYHPMHKVSIEPGTLLQRIISQRESIRVNTFHHQAVRRVGNGLQVGSRSPDGVIEAVESKSNSFVLGVQWHPEALSLAGKEGGQELFNAFVEAAKRQSKVES